jgi:hypothetical protein
MYLLSLYTRGQDTLSSGGFEKKARDNTFFSHPI